jgi:hypothetical protein
MAYSGVAVHGRRCPRRPGSGARLRSGGRREAASEQQQTEDDLEQASRDREHEPDASPDQLGGCARR